MFEINKNVVYVKGALNGAIYNFNDNKVYSINDKACQIIDDYISGMIKDENKDYIEKLVASQLLSRFFKPQKYFIFDNHEIKLKLAWIEITHACNLKCVHCYEGGSHRKLNNSLTLDEWKNVIDDLVSLGLKNLVVIGGEPTCSKHVVEILRYAKSKFLNTTLFTNAFYFTNELFETIKETNTSVKVSIYGHTSKIHDSITQVPGSFGKTISNVKKLIAANVEVISSVIIMRENEKHMDEIINFTKELGMKFYKYDIIRNVFGGKQNEHSPLTDYVLQKAYFIKPNFTISKEKFNNAFRLNTCWYGKLAITENGDVIPCEFERNIKYGNVKISSLKEIINSHKVKQNWFLDFSQIEICKDCEFRFACRDCRPLGLSVCGKIHSKNPRCLYDPYKGKWEMYKKCG